MDNIPLNHGLFALIDTEDSAKLNKYKWYAKLDQKNSREVYYACTNVWKKNKRTTLRMHRLLLKADKGVTIDHINGNGLDNRKSNLRIVTTRQNQQNRHDIRTSKYPGVVWHNKAQKWQAQLTKSGKNIYLGLFGSEFEAFEKYKKAVWDLTHEKIIEAVR